MKIKIDQKDLNFFLYIFFGIILLLGITLPNIYIDNQIYYESSIIDKYKKELRRYREMKSIIDNKIFNLKTTKDK